eukprot:CAMPEP_0180154368 /NCGR_PEP_ID=MMETSP0986-20121125/24122_1 /TAXON_ID=697907 /ORGANISM="non described non described, Strain CCMP2293" /LENGTH=454 /DNA_ID=CAMNT_0022102719 /DNA_START=120 /DNA_END=1484 /DNA_ORIENTATION=-
MVVRSVPQQESYSFPVLKPQEILQCFSELGHGIQLTREQLSEPTYEHVTKTMEQCLDMFMEFSAEENQQIRFSGMDAFEHPELHDNSIGQLAFNRSAMRFMHTCGMSDFALRDVYQPTAERVKKMFSAITNFAKYREDQIPLFEDLVAESESLKTEKELVDARFEELTTQLHSLREARAEEQEFLTELEEGNAEMAAHVQKLNVEQLRLKDQVHDVKQQRNDNGQKRDNAQLLCLNLRAEVAKMQSLVVRSPERVKREIVEMQAEAEGDSELLGEMDEKLQSLRNKIDGLGKTEREVVKLTRQLKDVEECLVKLKVANKDIKSIKAAQGEQDILKRESEDKQLSLRRQLHNISARAAELEARQKLKREAAVREKNKWAQAAEGAEKENEGFEVDIERMTEESRITEKKLQDLQNLEQAESSKFAEEKALVEERIRSYNLRILNAISETKSSFEA